MSSLSRMPERDEMRRSYLRVVIVWIVVLVGLFAFQEYFS